MANDYYSAKLRGGGSYKNGRGPSFRLAYIQYIHTFVSKLLFTTLVEGEGVNTITSLLL